MLAALGGTLVLVSATAATAAGPVAIPVLTAAPPLDAHLPATSWPDAATFDLPWDVVHVRAADEPATVRVASDARFIYVRFDVTQRAAVVASQHNNDTISGGSQGNNGSLSWSSDDAVWVDLWPTGATGFMYQFESNPIGAHNASSSENSAFSPQWQSFGAVRDGGYTVTMAIPFDVLHGAHSGTWNLQLIRYNRATAAQDVWSYNVAQSNADDVSRAGAVQITMTGKAAVPKPRAAVYALGSVASASAGGSTSRVGADFSIPVTPTAAVFAALHPDYSNVELDQQTISPSVYQRQYSEVRPFFTQAASYYNAFNCNACAYYTNLYTPAIPTFAQGYAFEGKQGPLGFAAFDAIGDGRNDAAAALDYTSPDNRWGATFQHVSADLTNLVDDSNLAGVRWTDHRYLSAYANAGNDTGTNVTAPGLATVFDGGGGYGTPHFALYGALRSVGPQFQPVDGYVTHAGIAGYALYTARIWDFSPSDKLASIGVSGYMDRYQGPVYGQAQSDNQLLLDLLTKSAWDLQLSSGSDYWRFGSVLTPISQNGGFSLTYHSGLQTNNPGSFPNHGSSAYPTQLSYSTGRYGAGRLDTWFRTTTMRVGERGTLSFAVDDTAQWIPEATSNIQWFDSVAYSYQINRDSSIAIGLRRVTGEPPEPNGGGNCSGVCSNVSVAYHLRLRHEEVYFAYGNPNTLNTVPQALLKVIFYLGGQKGT